MGPKLSPHRAHESNWIMSLLCWCGWHHWYRLNVGDRLAPSEIHFCRWCPKVEVNGAVVGE